MNSSLAVVYDKFMIIASEDFNNGRQKILPSLW